MLPGDPSLLRSRAHKTLLRPYKVSAIQLKVVVSRRRQ